MFACSLPDGLFLGVAARSEAMTAMLSCDGCGEIVSDRPEDDENDPTERWWALTPAPAIGGAGLLPMISISETTVEIDEDEEPADLPPREPDRHFCSVACVGLWAQRRGESETP